MQTICMHLVHTVYILVSNYSELYHEHKQEKLML